MGENGWANLPSWPGTGQDAEVAANIVGVFNMVCIAADSPQTLDGLAERIAAALATARREACAEFAEMTAAMVASHHAAAIAAQAEAARLREALLSYSKHGPHCDPFSRPCSCGLSAVLVGLPEIAAQEPTP